MKKILMIFVCMLFLISFANALEFDNIKGVKEVRRGESFNVGTKEIPYKDIWEKYPPLEIKNAFGMGETLFTGAITEHDEVCSKDCNSVLEVYLKERGELVQDVKFKTLIDEEWIEKPILDYQFSYWGKVDNYVEVCENITDETYIEGYREECSLVKDGLKDGWVNFDIEDEFESGNYKIKLDGEKIPKTTVDWIIKTNGKWLDDWAEWNYSDLIISGETTELCGDLYYMNVYINDSATVNICEYNGTAGTGEVNFYVAGEFVLESGSEINGDGDGWRGGNETIIYAPGGQTYGTSGEGDGAGGGACSHNKDHGAGGAGYGAYGGNGGYVTGEGATKRGVEYGTDSGDDIAKGSGGGSGAYRGMITSVIRGGDGGALLNVEAKNITITGKVSLVGENGANLGNGGNLYGGAAGGGSGGGIRLYAYIVNLDGANLDVEAGNGGRGTDTDDEQCGGGGGAGGRIKVFYNISESHSGITTDITGGSAGSNSGGCNNAGQSGGTGSLEYVQTTIELESPLLTTLNSPADDYYFNTELITFNCSGNRGLLNIENMSLWTNETGDWELRNSTTGIDAEEHTQTWNRNYNDGDYILWSCQTCDQSDECIFATENRTFTIDTSLPTVDVFSPTGDQGTYFSGRNLTLNWTTTDTNLDSCWYNYNGINTSIDCATAPENLTVTDPNNLTLIFYANDSAGNENSDSTTWFYSFVEENVTYEENVSETDNQTFEIDLTTGIDVLSISANLIYNGTAYPSESECDSRNCTLSNTFDIPLVESGESELRSFYWNFTIFDGSTETDITTTSRNQNVTRIHLEECGGAYTTEALNFTAYDEQTNDRINPFYFAGDFDYWLGSGSIKREANFINDSTNETRLCISPTDEDFYISAQVEYNEEDNSTTYDTRNYYFQDYIINNDNEDIFLYLLKAEDSTSFILKVQDTNLLPVEDALITVQRYFPSTGNFTTIYAVLTDDNGQTVGFFKTETVDYRFIISKDGQTLLTTGKRKIIPETTPYTIVFTVGFPDDPPWDSFEDLDNLTSSLTYSSTTNNVTFTYIDTSGEFELGRHRLVRQNAIGENTEICNTNSTSTSANIVCSTEGVRGTYIASGYITRDGEEYLVEQIVFTVETFTGVAGKYPLFLGWMIILVSAFAFKFNEIAGIVLINSAVILVNITGLINFGGLFIFGLMGVSIVTIVLIRK